MIRDFIKLHFYLLLEFPGIIMLACVSNQYFLRFFFLDRMQRLKSTRGPSLGL